MRVFKYSLKIADHTSVRLPYSAKILHVHEQDGGVYLWALVNPAETRLKRREFRIAGTGREVADIEDLHYIGTVHMNGGLLVFHVFEIITALEVQP